MCCVNLIPHNVSRINYTDFSGVDAQFTVHILQLSQELKRPLNFTYFHHLEFALGKLQNVDTECICKIINILYNPERRNYFVFQNIFG